MLGRETGSRQKDPVHTGMGPAVLPEMEKPAWSASQLKASVILSAQ